MALLLTDLLQSGMDTGGPSAVPRLRRLAVRCEDVGLHTGGALLTGLAEALDARSHTVTKDDLPAAALLCRAARYVSLCRERLEEEDIRAGWQSAAHPTGEQEQGGA